MPPATAPAPAAAPSSVDNAYLAPPPSAAASNGDQQIFSALNTNTPANQAPPSILPTATAPTSTPAFSFTPGALPTYNAPDISQFGSAGQGTALVSAQTNALSQLMKDQASLQQNAFQQYNQALASQGSSMDRYNQLSTQMGLPVYQQQMTTIKGLLDRLSDDITGQVQGSFMTQAQRDNMEAIRGKSLNQQLGSIGANEQMGESNIAKIMDYTSQDNANKLKPLETYLASLDSAFGRQLTSAQAANSEGLSAWGTSVDNTMKQQQLALDQQKLALQQRIANMGLGTDFGGLPTPTATAPGAPSSFAGNNPVIDAFNLVHSYRGGGANTSSGGWSGAASFLQSHGIDVKRGSAGDIALNRYFNGAGYNDYKKALQGEGNAGLLGYAW